MSIGTFGSINLRTGGIVLLLIIFHLSSHVNAFITNKPLQVYHMNSTIPLVVNKIISEKTKTSFAYGELPFTCKSFNDNRGSLLENSFHGDRRSRSNFTLSLGQNARCNALCSVDIDSKESNRVKSFIQLNYRVEWIVDNVQGISKKEKERFVPYFDLGYNMKEKTFIYNHFDLNIIYQTSPENQNNKYIVGFQVQPSSIVTLSSIDNPNECLTLTNTTKMKEIRNEETTIHYTYTITWKEVVHHINTQYNEPHHANIYWISILNSLVFTLFFIAIIGLILLRILRRDINIYNRENKDESNEGWKLMHGDVFRPPRFSMWLGPILGSGIQFINMSFFTLALIGLLGLLDTSYKGGFILYGVSMYFLSGLFSGYTSTLIHNALEENNSWMFNALVTSFFVPATLFLIAFIINLFILYENYSYAIPISTFTWLLVLWFGISIPFVYLGAYLCESNKKKGTKDGCVTPVQNNQTIGQIACYSWQIQTLSRCIFGGIISFSILYIDLFYIIQSVWSEKYYYVFGLLLVIFTMSGINMMIISIGITYFSFCCEDYRWWWNSFNISFISTVYIFMYSIYYYFENVSLVGTMPSVVYLGYSLILCSIYGICMGTIGFFSTFYFVRSIYTPVKTD